MPLIKSNNAPADVRAFSMKDIEAQAAAMLSHARQQADRLLAAAQTEAEKLKQLAQAEGFEVGKTEGLAAGREAGTKAGRDQALGEHKAQLTSLVQALTSAAAELDRSRHELEAAGVRDVLDLSIAIAERVTKKQGALDPSVAVANVAEAMKLVTHTSDVRIAVHPEQNTVLADALPRLKLQWPALKHVEIIDDSAIAPGGCRIFTAQGEVDGDLDGQLNRIVADLLPERQEALMSLLAAQLETVRGHMPFRVVGRVQGISGLTIEAAELPVPLGSVCRVHSIGGQGALTEVVGFRQGRTLLMPLSPAAGLAQGDRIENISTAPRIWCSQELLGRVIDGYGRPIDERGPLRHCQSRRIDGRGAAPLDRRAIDKPISTSIRAIDGLHTCGMGQRMGIFSGPGVGKSTLISSVARHTGADVSVVALIGERGREVRDFLENALGPEGLRKCVVVVSTSDDPPPLRVRAAKVACTVAESFRDEGNDVLLLMDSLTRLCQAQRQIGLAAQEPPATRGYPPSVFAMLPEILERAGRTERGSITGFYTVLVEGDDFNEPIADAVKGITDGHLWLSRSLANRGHFPAIDVLQSISRVRPDVTDKDHQRAARRVVALLAVYQDIEDLVNIGAYVPGVNLEFDLAVQARPKLLQYLQQEAGVASTFEQSRKQLTELAAWVDQLDKALRAQPANKSAPRASAAVM